MDPFAALKNMSNALEKVRAAEDKVALVDQIDVLRGALLDTREAVSDLQDKVTEQRQEIAVLRSELAGRDSWDAQAARYALAKQESGVFVQALRPEAANGDPEHCACPKCFAERRVQILQCQAEPQLWEAEDVYRAVHCCPSCNSKFSFGILPIPGPQAEHDSQNEEFERALRTRSPITGY